MLAVQYPGNWSRVMVELTVKATGEVDLHSDTSAVLSPIKDSCKALDWQCNRQAC